LRADRDKVTGITVAGILWWRWSREPAAGALAILRGGARDLPSKTGFTGN
jgi:hypothetical protein